MTSPADGAAGGATPEGAAAGTPAAAAGTPAAADSPAAAAGRTADVLLRPLVPADLDALEDMEEALFGAGAWSRASLAEEIAGPGRWYVGAQDRASGELVGYAGLWFDGYDGQVMTVGTRPDAQGRGIGRMLLDALLDRARELGAGDVLLEVRVDNEPALRLYERAGFERFGRRKGYYQPENVDAWTMRRRA